MRITKKHVICYAVSCAVIPPTREEIMRLVHALERKDTPFSASSNNCYFSPTGRGNGGQASVVHQGLVKRVGSRGHAITYSLTEAGYRASRAYQERELEKLFGR